MKIGILGAGNVGTGIGKRLAAKGHDVLLSFARSDESLQRAAGVVGRARTGSPQEAVAHGEVVLLATPWDATLALVRSLADVLVGKRVWDATNPLKRDLSGLQVGLDTSGGEEVARAAPGAHVVKAIPPFAEVLHGPSTMIQGRLPSVFVSGDDAESRCVVLALIDDIEADGIDAGSLAMARYSEPMGMLLVQLAYVTGHLPRVGTALLREA